MRNWTLNEIHGYYVATGLTDSLIDLSLKYKNRAREVSHVGHFRLNLAALSAAGVVTSRNVESGVIFDVRIVRETDGTFWLSVRNANRLPFKQLPHRTPIVDTLRS